jgi:hypothetical protein
MGWMANFTPSSSPMKTSPSTSTNCSPPTWTRNSSSAASPGFQEPNDPADYRSQSPASMMTPLERMRLGELALRHPAPPGVILEAANPAEIKDHGRGMTLTAGVARSPFGDCLIADSPRGICHLSFFDPGGETMAIAELHAAWPLAEIAWNQHATRLSDEILTPAPPSRHRCRKSWCAARISNCVSGAR